MLGRGSDEVSVSLYGFLFYELLGVWFFLNWYVYFKYLVIGTYCLW